MTDDAPSFLFHRPGGRGVAPKVEAQKCATCGEALTEARSDGLCLRCAWTGGPSEPWRWLPGAELLVPPAGYASPTAPQQHQLAAVAAAGGRDAFAYLMDYGTGKSKVALDEWAAMVEAGASRDFFLTAPAGVYLGWREQLELHLPPELLRRSFIAAWRSDGSARNKKLMGTLLRATDRPRVLLMNVEALSTSRKAKQLAADFLASRRGAYAAADESTTLRNAESLRQQEMVYLRPLTAFRRLLTGLPTPRSPLDLFGQFEFLDWRILGHRSWWNFRARYAVTREVERELPGGRTQRQRIVVAYRNVPELREAVTPSAFRVLKKDCLDLPPKVYAPIRAVELTEEQRRVYREVRDLATSQLSSMAHVTATDVMTRRLRLLQVAHGFVRDEEGRLHELPSNRLRGLTDLLEEADQPTIIWAPWLPLLRATVELLRKNYGPRSTVRFWGKSEVPDAEREESVRRFQEDPACRFFVSNPATGGRGRTLTRAALVVYLANNDDLEQRLNSEDRPHRIGLDHPVTYVDFVAPGTVEEKQIASFRRKLDLAASVMGDPPAEWLV